MLQHSMVPSARWAPGVLVALCLPFAVAGCGVNASPSVQKVSDQTAAVGLELTIALHATDADGDPLSYSFDAPELPDLADRKPPATLTTLDDGSAVFKWIPAASDSRPDPYEIRFHVSDGRATATLSVAVTVRDQGGDGAPMFVKPIGSGTTLQLDATPCLQLPVEAADTDSTMVTLAEEAPLVGGGVLTQSGPFNGTWQWCPSATQVASQDRFYLHLSADDGTNPKTIKPPYLIVVISSGKGMNCPGDAPVITHTPLDAQSTVQDLPVKLDVTDDQGLKATPLLYWSTTDPGPTPDLTKMTPVATVRSSGDATAGSYTGTIPNPVASAAPGTSKKIYYLLVARDNDDPTGGCNHTTYAPATGAYAFSVTAAGDGGLAACASCTSDAQCGGPDDNCVTIGGSTRCATACGSGDACPTGYTCSSATLTSTDGKNAKQCLPASGSCVPTSTCTDDALEENDSMSAIANPTAANLTGTSYPNLMICPLPAGGVDEDWFGLPITVEGTVQVSIASSASTDLDLELFDQMGNLLDYGLSVTSNETASACVRADAGKLFARVFSLSASPAAAPYALTVHRTPMACPCQADFDEPDDNAAQAYAFGRPTAAASLSGLTICPGNYDFFGVTLQAGDQITVDLTFTQLDSNGDLDIHFYKPDGTTDLTPCSPTQSGCLTTNGQGYQSNEHFFWTVATAGTYYVVIRGYDSTDTNSYSLQVKVN
jgi:hypothetical protein